MMRRRDFLRATLVTAGSVVVPTACSEEEGLPGACDVLENDSFFPQSVASGDPKPDSVVLWTRVVDGDRKTDLAVALVVALDEAFTQPVELKLTSSNVAAMGSGSTRVPVTARAEFDYCVKVKVSGLSPGTTYYYRFYYTTGEGCFSSRVGRTKTAPAPDADVPVRFAFVSCQDYVGRYFNALAALANQPIDFVVHLGDYIHETTGDPSSQPPAPERKVALSDVNGAIALTSADDVAYHAARSLNNYRELYRTYRSDRALQRVHERFPVIAIWDDHEFSDDCHGATATYFNGREQEEDEYRRKAANQAWFEYMPVDYRAGDDFRYDRSAEYPEDISIYRDFTFGKHVHLVMTDLRSYRADHLIPEDAFPGKIVVNEPALVALFGTPPQYASPYVADIDDDQYRVYRDMLEEIAPTFGFDPSFGYKQGEGPRIISATFINEIVAKLNEPREEEDQLPLIDNTTLGFLEDGISYADLGKTDYFSAFGSRYLVVKDAFDTVSQLVGNVQVLGAAQKAWFKDVISESDKESKSTWTVWGNSCCLSQLAIDLSPSNEESDNPWRYYLRCDGWDGFRAERNEVITALAERGNAVAITGDLHAFLAGTPAVDTAPTTKIVEFVGAAIAASSLRSTLEKQVASHPLLKDNPIAGNIAAEIEDYLVDKELKTNPQLAFCKPDGNGFCIAEANADEFVVTMHLLPESALATPLYEEADAAALEEQITIERFKTVKTAPGEPPELFRDEGGTWQKWNPDTVDWES
ncbi:alkaline phosphatase D family protein [Sorangium sp. So ce1097]|uniref:alkaline phosphatase D family protein n=1 Tax=Sorangium sp. So ce1097 TaxID=3133330 RepID=UPI003F63E8D9